MMQRDASLRPRALSPDASADEAGIAEIVRMAAARRETLLINGAGTKAGMLRPVQAARTLSTRALTGVSLYAPKELVLSAAAGTTVAELETLLAASGQHLIAEPPDYSVLLDAGRPGRQTIGGIVATNLAGPRRIAWGSMRDHVLGLRAVDGNGTVIRSGGRVLKNVTGLDLCKLLTGSHGTLGVITEVTLKVLPAPETTGSVMLRGLQPAAAVAALSAALGSPYSVTGAAFLPNAAAALLMQACQDQPDLCKADFDRLDSSRAERSRRNRAAEDEPSITLVRIEDLEHSVPYRIGRLCELLARFGDVTRVDNACSRMAWAAIRDATVLPARTQDAIWRISVRPSRGPAILAAAQSLGARGYLDWGGGLAMIAGPANDEVHGALTWAVGEAGGVWTLLRGPAPWRASVEVVPREAPALAAITRRVKAAMDPHGILNPGRLYAGL